MPDELIDRVADDLASGRAVDWAAVIAAAATPGERQQLESLRLVHQMSKGAHDTAVTVAVADTLPAAAPPDGEGLPATQPRWGRYVIVHQAGAGSFGTVYRAIDPDLQLEVAIKVLHRRVDSDLLREPLLREGRALAAVRHQNVVRVHGVEFRDDRVGLCTEFIEGETLETEVRTHGTFSRAQAIEVGQAVCQALSAVHRAGFIHRDVKARNVMRERDTGRVVLMDFGTGLELGRALTWPVLGLTGTAIYMAPEVLENEPASISSDVYSVGVLLYFLLTGAYPVEGASVEELKSAHRKGLRTALGDRRPDLSPAFLRVIEKALEPQRSRYATPAALSAALEAVRTERPRWVQQLKVAAVTGMLALAGLTVLGFVNTYYFNSSLGRIGFVEDGPLEWLKWGARSVVSPVVIAALMVLALTLLIECLQLLTRFSATARDVKQRGASLMHRWSLDDVAVLSSASFLSSAAVLFAAWWYFTPLLSTLTTSLDPDISTVPLENLRWLSPEYADYHVSYRKTFVATTLACVMLWYPTVRFAVRTRQRVPRRSLIGGSIVLAFSLLLLDFPYRLLMHDIFFDEVTWEGRSCHVLAARKDDRLIFCPSLPVPRNRIVAAGALTLVNSAPVQWWEEGSDVKRRKSIFKFLVTPPAAAGEDRVP